MVRHIVWWTLKDQAEGRSAAENAKRIVEGAEILKGIAAVRSLEISSDIQLGTTVPVQLVLTTTHDSMDDLKSYAQDPVHLDFAKIVVAASSSRNCIDFVYE